MAGPLDPPGECAGTAGQPALDTGPPLTCYWYEGEAMLTKVKRAIIWYLTLLAPFALKLTLVLLFWSECIYGRNLWVFILCQNGVTFSWTLEPNLRHFWTDNIKTEMFPSSEIVSRVKICPWFASVRFRGLSGGWGPNVIYWDIYVINLIVIVVFSPRPSRGHQNLTEANQGHIFTLLKISELGDILVLMWSVQKCLK